MDPEETSEAPLETEATPTEPGAEAPQAEESAPTEETSEREPNWKNESFKFRRLHEEASSRLKDLEANQQGIAQLASFLQANPDIKEMIAARLQGKPAAPAVSDEEEQKRLLEKPVPTILGMQKDLAATKAALERQQALLNEQRMQVLVQEAYNTFDPILDRMMTEKGLDPADNELRQFLAETTWGKTVQVGVAPNDESKIRSAFETAARFVRGKQAPAKRPPPSTSRPGGAVKGTAGTKLTEDQRLAGFLAALGG